MGQAFFSQGLNAPSYVHPNSYSGPVTAPTNQFNSANGISEKDLILAINKMFGTAPARSVRAHSGVPFLLPAESGIVPNVPSAEANAKAVQLIEQAKVPQELDQATQAAMISNYLKSQGYLK